MFKSVKYILLLIPVLAVFGCSSGTSAPPADISYNSAVFNPETSEIPLPNILATSTAADPLLGRVANQPMTPLEALAYVNIYEADNTNAVAGMNAPIYIRFQMPVDPATVTAAAVKVFQLGIDANGLTESNPLSFTDISTLFDFRYVSGSTDLQLFPRFPLLPATRYLYVVTSDVKDAATGRSVVGSFYFEALKATTPLPAGYSALEMIRDNVYTDAGKTAVKLSGYAKIMDDLIAKSSTTTVSSRKDIALLGRFITSATGYISSDATNDSTKVASRIPVESALKAFAAGELGKTWVNKVDADNIRIFEAGTYWASGGLSATDFPSSLKKVVTGTFSSADLSIDPVIAQRNRSVLGDLSAVTGAYSPVAGVVQPFRSAAALTGFYHIPRKVPFIYLVPENPNGSIVIFQHGITGYKEQVLALAEALTTYGYAVVAIDLPLHGGLAISGHSAGTEWGQDFIQIGAPLASRSNIQQAAFNLNRLETTMKAGGFIGIAGISEPPGEIKFVSLSLGSIVGAYYLAGNTTLTAGVYNSTSLLNDMKGFLSVPGGRLAYLLQQSATFGPLVNSGLTANGIPTGSPTYHNFFQITQSIIDPVDPATMTTPLAVGLPSRLSGRIAVQEVIGDQVFPNENTRYFGNALGGRGVMGGAGALVAPGFRQLGYRGGATPRIPALFMYGMTSGAVTPKVDFAASINDFTNAPTEGYFQFDNAGVNHGFLIDPSNMTNIVLAQTQMVSFLLFGAVVDPQ